MYIKFWQGILIHFEKSSSLVKSLMQKVFSDKRLNLSDLLFDHLVYGVIFFIESIVLNVTKRIRPDLKW